MPSPLKEVTIIGGGLAGLTLGIGLRQRGIPTTVWEKSSYPRHRVCGEFISGRGQEVLTRLKLDALFFRAGAVKAHTARFFLGSTCSPERPVTPAALCLDRFTLDALLAEHFRFCGGNLHENMRWDGAPGGEGTVLANGRRSRPGAKGPNWFGLKIHARGVAASADLEMHAVKHGYVGLSRLPDGETNVCGLFRSRVPLNEGHAANLLRGEPGSILHERLGRANFDQASFCSVAGISLAPQHASDSTECRIGDALTMVPPVTGNGMSMAFEGAEMALEPLAAWSRGESSWAAAKQRIAETCDRAFATRLAWARRLQWLMLTPLMRGQLGTLVLKSDWLWHFMFARTR